MDSPVIALMGPTASGKTDLAMALRSKLPLEIISVDSAMVYRGMDIGTAKPTPAELQEVPHRLIDICDPVEAYSVADFCRDAEREIADIHGSGRIPLLVGGTMMYFKSLLEGLSDMPAADKVVREAIEVEAKLKGWPHLHRELAKIDPDYAAQIHPNHSQRILRGLEVYRCCGKTMTELRQQQNNRRPLIDRFRVIQLALFPEDRHGLHQQILQRFEKMLEQGFIEEVRSLRSRNDLTVDLPSVRAVGYRQVWKYLDGLAGKDEPMDVQALVDTGVAATRQLAKRQLTWLKNWPNLHKFSPDFKKSEKIVDSVLNFLSIKSI